MKKKKRPKRTDTKVYQQKQIKKLKNKCLQLWGLVVRHQSGNRCFYPGCEVTKRLQPHHIEDKLTAYILRYDPKNGLLSCPGHHKFKKESAHRSFVTVYEYMTKNRLEDIEYLRVKIQEPFGAQDITREYLEQQKLSLECMLEVLCGNVNARGAEKKEKKLMLS